MTQRPVTLADIAREAGTSASTASRALSGRGYVSPEAREKLQAIAERLGYVPNASARTLKQQTSRVIGVVVSDLSNHFYATLAAGIEQTLRAANYQMLLLGDNSESEEEVEGARAFLAMRAAGVIMTPAGSEAAALLALHGTAVVEVDRRLAKGPCDAVVIDNARGAREAVTHLLELGHERIALLMARTTWTTDSGRLNGYRAALVKAGLTVDPRLVLKVGVHEANAERRIEALLDDARPTAVFAANNILAEQAWQVARRRELRIPDELSLVAFDDVPWMEMVDPGITAVAQPALEMGRRAAALLLRRLADGSCPPQVDCLQPSLVRRASTAPPR